ncbi:MAG: tRNA (N(6)-L-threonylcarbamoyladenosine(37)-C(2))-methylthiotransferase MtaB [Oscillospiraceae bacterium]|jgi:threonylcarbamoyladenosine tRNA methylthiotransferase MtaB|nr:tRNA (N(6)-L-threonylcarbamoyladenosine(37)-C(2))-methylthiotransferase MtaB [Oscillospiraceae bacterium]
MKVKIHTLGCKVNQYESQVMLERLTATGYETAERDSEADILVVNSCTVTGEADRKTGQLIRKLRRANPECVLILTGCVPQAFPEISEKLPEADIILGNSNRAVIADCIGEFLSCHRRIVKIEAHSNEYHNENGISKFNWRTRVIMKIEDGCNRFCSYCIIPYARGRVRSRAISDIKAETEKLAGSFKEVVLVGINLSAYGQDLGLTLCDAVDAVAESAEIKRIRLGSLECDLLTDEVLEKLSRQDKLCPHFHLSLQSGCDSTLKRMNRKYDTAFFRNICAKIRESFPNAALTTDVMVGFPGESEEEFSSSMDFVREIGFSRIHVFAYSKRPGTKAADLPLQVTREVKDRRSREMIQLGDELSRAFLESLVGSRCTVLIESERAEGVYAGYSENYIEVVLKGDFSVGDMVTAEITGTDGQQCTGVRAAG